VIFSFVIDAYSRRIVGWQFVSHALDVERPSGAEHDRDRRPRRP
jgi:hypothetical protein